MKTVKRIDLLYREVQDLAAQENFFRIKAFLEQLAKTVDGLSTSVSNSTDALTDIFGWYFIPAGTHLLVEVNRQFLFNGPLTIEGTLEIDGQAVEVD